MNRLSPLEKRRCGSTSFLYLKEGLQLLQSKIATAGEQSSPYQDRPRNTALTAGSVQKVHLKFLNGKWVSIIIFFTTLCKT